MAAKIAGRERERCGAAMAADRKAALFAGAQRTSAGVANRAAQCGSRKTSGALFLRTYTELGQTYSARGSGRRRKVGARKREAERDTPREQARKVLDPIGLGLASNRDRAQAKESFPDPR